MFLRFFLELNLEVWLWVFCCQGFFFVMGDIFLRFHGTFTSDWFRLILKFSLSLLLCGISFSKKLLKKKVSTERISMFCVNFQDFWRWGDVFYLGREGIWIECQKDWLWNLKFLLIKFIGWMIEWWSFLIKWNLLIWLVFWVRFSNLKFIDLTTVNIHLFK